MSEKKLSNKRDLQRIERKNQILECSLDMIISRGYGAMKIRDIAKKLNISTGLFFNYFESKEKVYEELVRMGHLGPRNVFQMTSEGTEPIEFFEKMTEIIFESLRSCSITSKIFLLMIHTMKSDDVPQNIKKMVSHFDAIEPVILLIQKGQKLGQIRLGDPLSLALAYWGAVQGIAESYALKPNLPLPDSKWIVDILREPKTH